MVFHVRNIWTNRVWCALLVAVVVISSVSPATPQNSKTEPQRRYEEAMSFIVRGQDKEALAAVEALVKDFPTDYKSRLLLAELYFALGREPDARASVDQTIRLHPRESGPYELLGSIAEDKGEWAQAEVHRRKAVEVNSKDAKLYFGLGTVLAIQNKYGAASAAFGQAAALSADWQHARSNADVYAQLDRLQKAGRATSSVRLPVMGLTIARVYGAEEFVVLAISHGGSKIVDEIRRIKPVKPSLVFRLEYFPKGDAPKWTCSSAREDETNVPDRECVRGR